jgi:hypothetical protein
MTTVLKAFPTAKNQMCVSPVQWLPGSLSASIPLFAVSNRAPNTLFLRADDPNIYGISGGNLTQNPQVIKNNIEIVGNKGCNFYSAPWCISTFGARDTGKTIPITTIDPSVYTYISALYTLVGTVAITLTDWRLEQEGSVKLYQILQGSRYTNINGTTYFGGTSQLNTQISGTGVSSLIDSPIIVDDFKYNGESGSIPTIQMTYNTFCAVNIPIVLSAIDLTNPGNGRVYFTLQNNVTMYNSPT